MSALNGTLVFDLTETKSGAICGMFLADNGARVIRLSPTGPIRNNDPETAIFDRGKEFLKGSSDDFLLCAQMLYKADVVIHDGTTLEGIKERLSSKGFPSGTPGLIDCHISSYGKKGPFANANEDVELVKARVGLFYDTPGFREGPTYLVHPVVEVGAGIFAALGVVSCLVSRLSHGMGMSFDVSLMAAGMYFMTMADGDNVVTPGKDATPFGGAPFYSVYKCRDGKWFQIACIHLGFVDQAAAVLGLVEILTEARFGGGRPIDLEARQELVELVRQRFLSKSSSVWAEQFDEADVPFAIVETVDAAMENEQVIHNDLLANIDDPLFGPMVQNGIPLRLSKTHGSIIGPRRELLWEGIEEEPVQGKGFPQDLKHHKQLPLKGVRVADITNVIAGPAAGRILGDLGADVLKIEPLTGDFTRGPGATFNALNANKRSISIDSKKPDGVTVLREIVSGCDALVANLRPGATERMGLGRKVLEAINPSIVETHITGFGWDGPLSSRPGMDPLAQAYMGLQDAQGGKGTRPSYLTYLAPCDFTAGVIAALGTVLGLYVVKKGGTGQKIDVDLLSVGSLMLQGDFSKYSGKQERRLADPGQYGLSDFRRLYQASDGWIFVCAEDSLLAKKLLQIMDLQVNGIINFEVHSDLGKQMAKSFLINTTEHWVQLLASDGVPVAVAEKADFARLHHDAQIQANRMLKTFVDHNGGNVHILQGFLDFGDVDDNVRCMAPRLGEHNREILQETNIPETKINALESQGVISRRFVS